MNSTVMHEKIDAERVAPGNKVLQGLGFLAVSLKQLLRGLLAPLVAFVIFLVLWNAGAAQINTSLGQVPGPAQVWSQAVGLLDEHFTERDKEQAFYERQQKRNAAKLAKNPDAKVKIRPYTGKPTFIDQIFTSLYIPI